MCRRGRDPGAGTGRFDAGSDDPATAGPSRLKARSPIRSWSTRFSGRWITSTSSRSYGSPPTWRTLRAEGEEPFDRRAVGVLGDRLDPVGHALDHPLRDRVIASSLVAK